MFCHKCGNKIIDGSAFCSQCGAKIENNNTIQKGSALPKSKGGTAGIIAVGILVALFVIGNVGNKDSSNSKEDLDSVKSNIELSGPENPDEARSIFNEWMFDDHRFKYQHDCELLDENDTSRTNHGSYLYIYFS